MTSSASSHQDRDGLIQKFLDGDLSAVEQREFDRLLNSSSFCALLAEYAIDHTQIHELSQQGLLGEVEVERLPRRHTRRRWGWCVAAAVSLVVAIGLFLQRESSDGGTVIGHVTRVAGHVTVEFDGPVDDLGGESDLCSGATIHVGGLAGLARLRFDDGTEISLSGETRLTCIRENGQTRLAMQHGQLTANVVPQAAGCPLTIDTSNAAIEVLGTRLAVSNEDEISELGVHHGRVRIRRLSDGKVIEVEGGQYAVASQRAALEARPWPEVADTWTQEFEEGLPEDWRYGQWIDDGLPDGSHGGVLASQRSVLEGIDSDHHRITLPKRWTRGLWQIHEDSRLCFTYKMTHPGWFQIVMGVRSDDLNPSHVGNYELQSSYWPKTLADEWRTVSAPLSAFRKNRRGVEYSALPSEPPRPGDIVPLLWFSTGKEDRGLVIDRIWIDRVDQSREVSP